jgi:hypothetical protein
MSPHPLTLKDAPFSQREKETREGKGKTRNFESNK